MKPIWLHHQPLWVTKALGGRFFPAHPEDERDQIIQTIWETAAERPCRKMDAEAYFDHLSTEVGKQGIGSLSRIGVDRIRVWLFHDGDAEYWRL